MKFRNEPQAHHRCNHRVRAACFGGLLPALVLLLCQTALGADVLGNGDFVDEDFGDGVGWEAADNQPPFVGDEELAVWTDDPYPGAILRVCQDGAAGRGGSTLSKQVSLQEGYDYQLSFWAAQQALYDVGQPGGDPDCSSLHAGVSYGLEVEIVGASSGTLLAETVSVAPCGTSCGGTHQFSLVAPASESATVHFSFGGQWTKLKLAGAELQESSPDGGDASAVHVNQWGYLASGPKSASVESDSGSALPWELLGSDQSVLTSGTTVPVGSDTLSGTSTHHVDFSSFNGSGSGLSLRVDGAVSETFTLADDLYAPLLRDALRFFHHQRCGGNVDATSAESAQWARGAGHSGDAVATCSAGQSCNVGYPLDASGGWHDAGDYGKYVVNGGIAVWTLLDLYERSQLWGTRPQLLGDGTLNLGTSDGSSDLLDLARWEMEFLLGMQVPQGNPLAGMAHHKLHANDWVTAPTLPEDDSPTRYLQPPSTAATLNLAATAAQCARVWRDRDVAFAERCSTAAERAWTAALQNPSRYAPASSNVGGGPYDDQDASDEFYWAAAELFVTTGKPEYATYLRGSRHFAGFRGGAAGGPFAWPSTAGLGTLSLALVPNALTSTEVRQLREAIVAEAERYLGIEAATGYRVPLDAVYWGSNSEVTNAGMVLAFAHDLTGDTRYRAGAASAVDYLLGNNPLSQSYVSGYGERAVETVHHLTFASDIDQGFPSVPPGFVVGGPNADLDAFANPGVSTSCSPLACFAEQTGAYWFVEVAINWNASLAWLAAWLDESGQQPRSAAVGVNSGFAGFEDRIVGDPSEGGGGSGGSGGGSSGGSGGASSSSGTAGSGSGSTGSTEEAGSEDISGAQSSSDGSGKKKRSGGCSTAPGGAQPLGSPWPAWPLWLVGVAYLTQRHRRRRRRVAAGTRI